MAQCAECGKEAANPRFWQGVSYCSKECRHDAGDRSACRGWNCGCTKYAKKRRLLNRHRQEMRIMTDVLEANGLGEELQDTIVEATGNTGFYLGFDTGLDGLDEDSDQEDSELELRKEVLEKKSLIDAVTCALQNRGLATELERSRMQMEDFRSQLIRKQS